MTPAPSIEAVRAAAQGSTSFSRLRRRAARRRAQSLRLFAGLLALALLAWALVVVLAAIA